MEVRPDILEQLVCSVCGEYLSCEPIRMTRNGTALCGRCCDPGQTTLRIEPYEETETFRFPCANKTYGCKETVLMRDIKDHEEECDYKQFVCPVTESGQCDWSGCTKNILDHCKEQHPDKLLQNPDTITHQINETNYKTFLLAAFQVLFIVQCKVCVATKSIYHSVRMIGQSPFVNDYEYVLKVLNKNKKLSMSRPVEERDSMALQEDPSVTVDFNTVLKLGEFKDTIFKIKVDCKCVYCEKRVFESLWPVDLGWCCKDCAPTTRQCKFHIAGCSYRDTEDRADDHEAYFCPYGTWCALCSKHVIAPRDQHYESAHADITYQAGATWRAPAVNEVKNFIITTDFGRLWCDYVFNDSQMIVNIYPPIHTEQLQEYTCLATVRNPDTGHAMRETIITVYEERPEWVLHLDKREYLMYVHDNKVDIKIELMKI